jgi:hypothetical protein
MGGDEDEGAESEKFVDLIRLFTIDLTRGKKDCY